MAGNWWSTLWGRQEVPPNPEETADRHFWDLFDAPEGTGGQPRRVIAAEAATAPDDEAAPGRPWQGPAAELSPFFPDPTPTLILPPGGLTALPGATDPRAAEESALAPGDAEASPADAPENSEVVADLSEHVDPAPAPAIETLAVDPPPIPPVPADPVETQDQPFPHVDPVDDGPQGHPDPVAATTPAAGIPPVRPHPEQNGLTVSQLDTFITELLAIEGATGAAVVDIESGMALATGGNPGFDLNVAAAGNSNVVRAKLRTMADLNLGGDTKIEDILITLSTQYHLINVLDEGTGSILFVYLVLNRSTANLALARHRLRGAAAAVKI